VLVYGDHADRADVAAVADRVAGRVRHTGCDSWSLVETGRLVQALLDEEMSRRGVDECTPLSASAAQVMLALAARDRGRALEALAHLARLAPAGDVLLRVPEGYAFYAVYPELYVRAARELTAPVQAIGIRSIGTSLAAVVAAARGSGPPLFVRPTGHPFRRELRIGPGLAARLVPPGEFAIVDEGPGLSGSSFLCVARELLARGVPAENIHLFPSHDKGPGPEAGAGDLMLWKRLPKHVGGFETLVDNLARWCEDLTGASIAPLDDVGGGAWRSRIRVDAPAMLRQERRKYLLHSQRGTFLLKFAGLGSAGDEVFRRARVLANGGFAPETLGLRNGFLVMRWLEARVPERRGSALEDEVARYVAFRSRALPAAPQTGATPPKLLEMAIRNTSLALGDAAGRALERWRPRLDQLGADTVRVETDNRMHRWEWLELPDGHLLKTDGAEHCRAHDLVGCQDAAWDLVGAAVELDLDLSTLLRRFRAHDGRGGAPELLAFARPCYLAFQLGACTIAAESLCDVPAEAARLGREADRYGGLLAEELRR
jgi:hypothetical protein